MEETLIIKRFGHIEDLTFRLKVINIFIGDQGTGKSTVAKLIVVIKAIFGPHPKRERLKEDLINFLLKQYNNN